MKHFYLLLLLCFLQLATRGQGLPGFVVSSRGDTLRGLVAEKVFQRIVYYPQPGATPQYFGPANARAYRINQFPLYTSYPVRLRAGKDSMRFVRPVLLGPASLYSPSADSTTLYLRPPARDTLLELTARNWGLLLAQNLGNCPAVDMTDTKLTGLPYSVRRVTNLIQRYNRCLQPGWQPTELNKRSTQAGVYLWASTLVVPESSYNDNRFGIAGSIMRPGLAAGADLRLLRSDAYWLTIGLGVQQLRGGDKPVPVYSGTTLYTASRQTKFQFTSLLLRTGLGRYFGNPGRVRPLALGQLSGGYVTAGQYLTTYSYSAVQPERRLSTDLSRHFTAQLTLGGGVSFPLVPRRSAQIILHFGQSMLLTRPAMRNSLLTLELGLDLGQ